MSKQIKSVRFLFDKIGDKEIHYEYLISKTYPLLGICTKITEHKAGDHYEVVFEDDKITTINIFCKTRVITKT